MFCPLWVCTLIIFSLCNLQRTPPGVILTFWLGSSFCCKDHALFLFFTVSIFTDGLTFVFIESILPSITDATSCSTSPKHDRSTPRLYNLRRVLFIKFGRVFFFFSFGFSYCDWKFWDFSTWTQFLLHLGVKYLQAKKKYLQLNPHWVNILYEATVEWQI